MSECVWRLSDALRECLLKLHDIDLTSDLVKLTIKDNNSSFCFNYDAFYHKVRGQNRFMATAISSRARSVSKNAGET